MEKLAQTNLRVSTLYGNSFYPLEKYFFVKPIVCLIFLTSKRRLIAFFLSVLWTPWAWPEGPYELGSALSSFCSSLRPFSGNWLSFSLYKLLEKSIWGYALQTRIFSEQFSSGKKWPNWSKCPIKRVFRLFR